jgi:LAO/AO transport system kinase
VPPAAPDDRPADPDSGAGREPSGADRLAALAGAVIDGDRRSLARAITLVESTRPDHRADAAHLLDLLLPHTGRAVRVGISGPPGVGKSTLIEALGTELASAGRTVAVLAVDPSSALGGGSILGDKTRMEELGRHPNAYIRPSPSGGALGGVARRTREAMLVCEAAGFGVVIVETVGVGQSETEVDDMVDTFALLVAAGGGDELQGIKRGVMELADLVVVTKADGDLLASARQAAADHRHALHLMRPKHPDWVVETLLASAVGAGSGLEEVWEAVQRHHRYLVDSGRLAERRAAQNRAWLWSEVRERLLAELHADPAVGALVGTVEGQVTSGELSPAAGAQLLLDGRRR